MKVSDKVLPPITGFEHYLWDIYGGFGHNGKIIQCTLPSHSAITLPGPVFET